MGIIDPKGECELLMSPMLLLTLLSDDCYKFDGENSGEQSEQGERTDALAGRGITQYSLEDRMEFTRECIGAQCGRQRRGILEVFEEFRV